MSDDPIKLTPGLIERMSVTTDDLEITKPPSPAKAVLAELRKLVADSDSH